jgi:arylsulfatase A-like enzyme
LSSVRLISSFWWFFRPIFVLFFLYLTGDAFYRWDGFRYYASFVEFIPGLALASILWCILAVITALLTSVTGVILKRVCRLTGWDISKQHFLLFTNFFILSGILSWIVKRRILHLGITLPITSIELACALTIAVFATWLLRSKAGQWVDVIQNRITPLVSLYGILVLLSVPVVAYHVLGKNSDTKRTENLTSSYSTTENRPNIILVTFDALSAHNMSVYGYHRPTTPFINEWAKNATVFTNTEAAGTFTALATVSLMTGKNAWTTNVYQLHSFNSLKSNIESLPVMLKKNGYHTMAFTPSQYSNEIIKSIGINGIDFAPPFHEFWSNTSLQGHLDAILARFFDGKIRLYNWVVQGDFILAELLILTNRYRDNSITDRPADIIFDRFLSYIRDNPQVPFFGWIHVHPPHFPYLPPKPYMGMINPSSKLRGNLDQYNALLMVEDFIKNGSIPLDEVQPQIDLLRDRYDEFIMYCDKHFEDFIKSLEAMNGLGKTIVILSADHGEIFTSTDIGHGGPPREHVTHIPFIIREADQNKQNIINDVVEQIDIPATILDLANIPVPSWMEGRSLVPLMRGKKLPEQPAFSVNLQSNQTGQSIHEGTVAVWDGDYKLIYDLDKKTSQLFNLKNDSDELNNIIDKEPAIGQHLLSLIMDKINKANQAFNKRQQPNQ